MTYPCLLSRTSHLSPTIFQTAFSANSTQLCTEHEVASRHLCANFYLAHLDGNSEHVAYLSTSIPSSYKHIESVWKLQTPSLYPHQPEQSMEADARRKAELRPSIRDFFLSPFFHLSVLLFQITSFRLLVALSLFPLYCTRQAISILPNILQHWSLLFSSGGRSCLCQKSDAYRQTEQNIASEQSTGTYRFAPDDVLANDDAPDLGTPKRVEIPVCGIKARVLHAKPVVLKQSSKQIVLVHGNPSWSYVWRNIVPSLTAAGHEVFSIDWLGHGASDKPINPRQISFELHMHTFTAVIRHFNLHDFYIAAHDWGGCVVLCTIPLLPREHKCAGLFLLNTFFPPRPSDISLHYYLLYWIWFFSTGIARSLLPDSLVLRFMAPNITAAVAEGYSVPYEQSLTKTKASINRFAHIVPGTPDWVLGLRGTRLWRVAEGLIGPKHLTNLNAQAALARRNVTVRKWWSKEKTERSAGSEKELLLLDVADMDRRDFAVPPEHVMILFGRDDPLLPEFRQILVDTIQVSKVVESSEGPWITGAGHYPMEQKPEVVARCIGELLQQY